MNDDKNNKKREIVITGNVVVTFVCVLGLIACAVNLIAGFFTNGEVNWTISIGVALACGMGIYLANKKANK